MSFVQKIKQSPRDLALAVARQTKHEAVEMNKSLNEQVMGKKDEGEKPKGLFKLSKPSFGMPDLKKEITEIPKTAVSQITGPSAVQEAMQQKTEIPRHNPYLDSSMQEAFQKRLEREKKWAEEQQEIFKRLEEKKKVQPGGPILPSSPTHGGAPNPGNKAAKIETGSKKH